MVINGCENKLSSCGSCFDPQPPFALTSAGSAHRFVTFVVRGFLSYNEGHEVKNEAKISKLKNYPPFCFA